MGESHSNSTGVYTGFEKARVLLHAQDEVSCFAKLPVKQVLLISRNEFEEEIVALFGVLVCYPVPRSDVFRQRSVVVTGSDIASSCRDTVVVTGYDVAICFRHRF